MLPEVVVDVTLQSDIPDRHAAWIAGGNQADQARAQIFVEEELHATELARRRSREAANARHARMSSSVRSGKSATISVSRMPPAKYSSTS